METASSSPRVSGGVGRATEFSPVVVALDDDFDWRVVELAGRPVGSSGPAASATARLAAAWPEGTAIGAAMRPRAKRWAKAVADATELRQRFLRRRRPAARSPGILELSASSMQPPSSPRRSYRTTTSGT